jgi:hypothetical protein
MSYTVIGRTRKSSVPVAVYIQGKERKISSQSVTHINNIVLLHHGIQAKGISIIATKWNSSRCETPGNSKICVGGNTSHNCIAGSTAPWHVAPSMSSENSAAKNCFVAAADPIHWVPHFPEIDQSIVLTRAPAEVGEYTILDYQVLSAVTDT